MGQITIIRANVAILYANGPLYGDGPTRTTVNEVKEGQMATINNDMSMKLIAAIEEQ